jgi:hypothetical protein
MSTVITYGLWQPPVGGDASVVHIYLDVVDDCVYLDIGPSYVRTWRLFDAHRRPRLALFVAWGCRLFGGRS